jgi:hypothetical protein
VRGGKEEGAEIVVMETGSFRRGEELHHDTFQYIHDQPNQ